MMLRRKFIWIIILMVWVGMVTSIIVYQGKDYLTLEKAGPELQKTAETTSDNVEIIEQSKSNGINSSTKDINYTQAKDNSGGGEDFFVESKLERDKYRSEQIDIYRQMINNPNTDETTRKQYHQKMMKLTDKMEKEMEIESLIRARGYKDALAFIHDNTVDVIVETNGLEKNDVAKIGDVIVKTTGFSFDDVTIIEKKAETTN